MMLQLQVNLLDKFVIQQESIPNMIPAMGQMQLNNRSLDGMSSLVKNVNHFTNNIFLKVYYHHF